MTEQVRSSTICDSVMTDLKENSTLGVFFKIRRHAMDVIWLRVTYVPVMVHTVSRHSP